MVYTLGFKYSYFPKWVILVTLLRLLCVVFDVSTFGHPLICILCGEMDHFSKNLYLCSSEERAMCGNFICGWSIALRCHTYINANILVNSVISIFVSYL